MKRYGFFILSAILIALGLFFNNNYYLTVTGVAILFNAVLVIALNMLLGFAGQISLGHAAFFGIGAYSSGILSVHFHASPIIGMVIGLFLASALSYAIARPIFRLKGHYLAMATLGLGLILNVVMVQAGKWTGGPDGLSGIAKLSVAGFVVHKDMIWYWLMSGFVMLTVWISLNLEDSRMGRALRAIHDSEVAAKSLGVDTSEAKAQVFMVSAAISSLAGSLFAHERGFISPDSFSFFFSVELVTMVILGGMGSTYGAFVGAALLTSLPELLTKFEDMKVMLYGAILMGTMIFMPNGILAPLVGIIQKITAKILKREMKDGMS